jgi:HPt (histidine-containing phosphotransfer) domain-containing protein
VAEIHLDHEVLSTLQEVMEDEYPLLLDTFLLDSVARLQQLHKADGAEQLIATAHSLKGSSSNMGAIRLAELCHELERQAKELSLGGIETLVAEIDGELAIVRPLYEEELKRFQY